MPLAKAKLSPSGTRLGIRPRFFQPSIIAGEHTRRPALLVDILRREQLLEQPDLVVGVENGEGRLEVDELGMAAQDLDADGVERAEPRHAFDRAADQLADALLHLARRLVGEGDGEDLRRAGRGPGSRIWAMRVVSTRVLPVPAPASTSSGPSSVSTASRCSGLSASK